MISMNGSGNCSSSAEKFYINSIGHLIVIYSNGSTEDLGLVVGTPGTNFYPSETGFEVPDGQFQQDKPIGWSYLSLANNTSILYFKTSGPNVNPSTWNTVQFGKGDTGDNGRSFTVDSQGTVFPTTGLFDKYTFLKTDTGQIFIYNIVSQLWEGPYQWTGQKGDVGAQGIFKIDSRGSTFPVIDDLPIGYTFYNTVSGNLYFVELDINDDKVWSSPVQFRGDEGLQGPKGDKGDQGDDGKQISSIYNVIDTSYPNALLVIGICPAGYVVSEIQVQVEQPFLAPVTEMKVRFGGTAQSEIDGEVIADYNCFDIGTVEKYIVNEINHLPSVVDEIISCIFDESVNNSGTGLIKIWVTLSPVLPQYPISSSI